MPGTDKRIRTHSCPDCYLCGTKGVILHEGLRDRLFGAPGVWDLRQCPNPPCGLIWLDPMPLEEDIVLAYVRYYTHQGAGDNKSLSKFLYRVLRGILVRATGLVREQRTMHTRYLGEQIPGKLLEVGCGAGDYLAQMRALGWSVEGVEIDPAACRVARESHGLAVHEGTLENKGYPDNSFDAVVMNHVIEHVFDPVDLLKECLRIAKQGGRVVVITPNTGSWGYRKFKESWRGLEPPRHIHLFSPRTLKKCSELAGIKKTLVTTTPANAEIILRGSLDIYEDGHVDTGPYSDHLILKSKRDAAALLMSLQEYRLWKKDSDLGEEVVLLCQK